VTDDLERTLAELRGAFDGAFAAPPRPAARDEVALLAIRAGGDAVTLRVLDVAGLLPLRKIVPLPSRRPELLGIVGLRGTVLPVYRLAQLLGRPAPAEPPRWIALAGSADRVGVAFEVFEGHIVVPARDVQPVSGPGHLAEVALVGGAPRPVVAIPSILRAIIRTSHGEST
jgi:chemotaxis signal transduction protein